MYKWSMAAFWIASFKVPKQLYNVYKYDSKFLHLVVSGRAQIRGPVSKYVIDHMFSTLTKSQMLISNGGTIIIATITAGYDMI